MKYSGNAKYIVSLSAIVVVGVLDRMESFLDSINRDILPRDKVTRTATEETDPLAKSLQLLLRSKNNLILIDAAQMLLRDIGLTVVPCRELPMLDRIIKIEDQEVQIALKVVGDINDLAKEWEHLDHNDGCIPCEEGRMRLLLIVNADDGGAMTTEQFSGKIPAHISKFLAERHTVAMTTQTLAQLYRLCKEMQQDPKRVMSRISHHSGGVFQL